MIGILSFKKETNGFIELWVCVRGGGLQIESVSPNIYIDDNIIADSDFLGITSLEMELLAKSCDHQPQNRVLLPV